MSTTKRQTMSKMNRERELKEKRALKQGRKEQKKLAAAACCRRRGRGLGRHSARLAHLDLDRHIQAPTGDRSLSGSWRSGT